jgi:hypothetical protein
MKSFSSFSNYYGFSTKYNVIKYLRKRCGPHSIRYLLWEERDGPYPPYKILQKLTIYQNRIIGVRECENYHHYSMFWCKDTNTVHVCNYLTSNEDYMLSRHHDNSNCGLNGTFKTYSQAIKHILNYHYFTKSEYSFVHHKIKPLNKRKEFKLGDLCALQLKRMLLSSPHSLYDLPYTQLMLKVPLTIAEQVCNHDILAVKQ